MVSFLRTFLPIVSLGINVVCQVCLSRYMSRFILLKSVFVGFAVGMCVLLSAELYYLCQAPLFLTRNISSAFANIITYSALGYCYFHFINLGETGRRIRILRELYDSKKGLSAAEILERYSAKDILEKRLHRLINNAQIICKDGRYYIGSPIMLLIAKIIVSMKLVVLGKRKEFD